MFFKRKTKKLDPKVRFQHKRFTGKLQSARNYKRQAVSVPDSNLDKILSAVGLRSRWSQIFFAIFLAAILYLVYIPNFLTIKNIEVTGLSDSQAQELRSAIEEGIKGSIFMYPQRNLLFFQDQVVRTAAGKIPSIAKVDKIRRYFGGQTLRVVAESKYERYLVKTPSSVYDVYSDGTLAKTSDIKPDQWSGVENQAMLKVSLEKDIQPKNFETIFDRGLITYLDGLDGLLGSIPDLPVISFQFKQPEPILETKDVIAEAESNDQLAEQAQLVEQKIAPEPAPPEQGEPDKDNAQEPLSLPITSSEVHAVVMNMQNLGNTYRIIFDATLDPAPTVENLRLLLLQTQPDRLRQLDYIDLRIPDKAFLCLKNSPCSK